MELNNGFEYILIEDLHTDISPITRLAAYLSLRYTVQARIDVGWKGQGRPRSEEHTSELQSLTNLVCRLLLEKITLAFVAGCGPRTSAKANSFTRAPRISPGRP